MWSQWKFLSAILVVFYLHKTTAQVSFAGQCPEYNAVPDFNIEKYMGTWYSISQYPVGPSANRRCTFAFYDDLVTVNGISNFEVVNGAIVIDTGLPSTVNLDATVVGPGEISVTFDGDNESRSVVLGTDYETYSCVLNCINVNETTFTEEVFILGRGRTLSAETRATANEILQRASVGLSWLEEVDQTNCNN